MGQIVRRRKKGRPSKADLTHRNAVSEPPSKAAKDRDVRRSVRCRNVRYTFDYDDYIDEDDYEDEEDERRREKKLELLMKLQSRDSGAESAPSQTQRVKHAPTASPSSSDYGDGSKPLKKRKIDGDDEIDGDVDEYDEGNEIDKVRGRRAVHKGVDSVPGTPLGAPSGVILPDNKTLELILDKLQKKDIYGVYAEPVDPEELPDYHDVIKHPMDFATVRSKLGNRSYSNLEQFESDVFLICTNAMKYNSPDTIYYKQACSIQELAKRKFQRLRIEVESSEKELKSENTIYYKQACSIQELAKRKFQRLRIEVESSEKELKSEQMTISNSLTKKQTKKPMSRTAQEPVGSDFSSGATLATAGDFQNGSSAARTGGCERPCSVDGLIEGNSSLIGNNLDKGEELLPAKGLLPRLGRKPSVHDENRRATYNISTPSVAASESIFTTFEGESRQLVPVGLQADHSYARSLARFAATLGSVVWKVASRRIEQALPAESKFGRGWVGEYEPLPTPVLMLENCTLKEPAFFTRSQCNDDVRKVDKTSKTSVSAKEHPVTGPTSEVKSPLFCPVGTRLTTTSSTSSLHPTKEEPVRGASLDGKSSISCSPGTKPTAGVSANYQRQNSLSRNFIEPEKKVSKKVELNCPPSANQSTADFVAERQISNGSELPDSRSLETVSRNRNLLHSGSFKQPNVDGGLPNGKAVSNSLDSNRMVTSSSGSFPNPMARATAYFPHAQEYSLSDPVQLMRMLAEKAQNQHKSSNPSPVDDIQPVVPPSKREDSSNAASAAARAWMSIGAGGNKQPVAENTSTHKNQFSADSLYNPTRDHHPPVSRFCGEFPVSGMHFQPDKNISPRNAFVPQPVRMSNETQFQNRPMVFPQFVTADLSRFQVHTPWRGLNPQIQLRQKQESFPPDLNIGFPSSGSPVRQSSGVLVDSQQPDLALQL